MKYIAMYGVGVGAVRIDGDGGFTETHKGQFNGTWREFDNKAELVAWLSKTGSYSSWKIYEVSDLVVNADVTITFEPKQEPKK